MSMLTVNDIAEDLKLKPATVTRYLREGRIKGTLALGGNWRVREADYQEFKDSLFPTKSTGHGFSPRDARSESARRAAKQRTA